MCDTRSPGDLRQRSVSAPCARRLRGASSLRGGRDWLWLSCRWLSNVWMPFVRCWRVRISRKSLPALGCIGRRITAGLAGLVDRSHRPHFSPAQVENAVEVAVAEMRRTYPRWGARRIRLEMLRKKGPWFRGDLV